MCSACVEGQWAIMGCQGTGGGGWGGSEGGGVHWRGGEAAEGPVYVAIVVGLYLYSPKTDIITWTFLKP